jgi:RHS repeat-associated protein
VDAPAGAQWHLFGARYYDPEIGRWMCPDPLADKHPDYTPYAYVYNQPTNLIDPFGLDSSATSSFFSSLFQGFANAFYSKPKEAENSNNGSENSKNDGSPPTEEQVAEQVGSEIGNNLGEFATNEFYIAISGGKEMSIIPAQGSIIFTKNNGVIKIGGLNVTKALDLIKAIKGGIPISVSF